MNLLSEKTINKLNSRKNLGLSYEFKIRITKLFFGISSKGAYVSVLKKYIPYFYAFYNIYVLLFNIYYILL